MITKEQQERIEELGKEVINNFPHPSRELRDNAIEIINILLDDANCNAETPVNNYFVLTIPYTVSLLLDDYLKLWGRCKDGSYEIAGNYVYVCTSYDMSSIKDITKTKKLEIEEQEIKNHIKGLKHIGYTTDYIIKGATMDEILEVGYDLLNNMSGVIAKMEKKYNVCEEGYGGRKYGRGTKNPHNVFEGIKSDIDTDIPLFFEDINFELLKMNEYLNSKNNR